MQCAEIDQDEQQFKQEIKELRVGIADLTTLCQTLEQENLRSSTLVRKFGRYIGLGAAGKLEWACFKLKFKQAQLARLVLHPDERMNGVSTLLRMVPAAKAAPELETKQAKMERMITENPLELEPHIRRAYQVLIEAEQEAPAIITLHPSVITSGT